MLVGLKDQIDELDHLLDRLLRLPLAQGPVEAFPATLKLPANTNDQATLHISQPEILPYVQNAISDSSIQTIPRNSSDMSFHPTLGNSNPTASEDGLLGSSTPEVLSEHEVPGRPINYEHQDENLVPSEETPWFHDEPLPGRVGSGPRVEIIHVSASQIVTTEKHFQQPETRPFSTHRSLLFWVLWFVTWCFDQTLGHWFPWLRRPSTKLFLGLVGAALCAVSIYLAWIARR